MNALEALSLLQNESGARREAAALELSALLRRDAKRGLLERRTNRIYRVPPPDQEELAQQVLLKLLDRFALGWRLPADLDEARARSYLQIMLVNFWISILRKRGRETPYLEDPSVEDDAPEHRDRGAAAAQRAQLLDASMDEEEEEPAAMVSLVAQGMTILEQALAEMLARRRADHREALQQGWQGLTRVCLTPGFGMADLLVEEGLTPQTSPDDAKRIRDRVLHAHHRARLAVLEGLDRLVAAGRLTPAQASLGRETCLLVLRRRQIEGSSGVVPADEEP
ncbi:MAG: hypothetical protein RBU45_22660 [Myxococcota bacterium]|jgi:DNA-directed RNA polymerase specialized sigma24 family protein|nr:hypothetical protein [Myxococcota bacterium]